MMTSATIGVTGLRAKYSGEEKLVFKDLSLQIPQGQKLLLLGPSGCGKSTLLHIMSGIIPGTIRMPVVAEHIEKPASWGFVFQDPDTQFCMSYVDEELAFVLENQRLPQAQMKQRILEALDTVQLRLPRLHTPIAELSQGMKQRLALAATLLLQPEVVFLDEPSALLDPEGKQMIWQSIRAALQQQTVIVVEHHIDGILDWFERVVVLDDAGSIIADEKPQTMFEQHKTLLLQYGIWHPHIWEQAWQSKPVRRFRSIDPVKRKQIDHAGSTKHAMQAQAAPPLLELEGFSVTRGACTVEVPYAAAGQGEWIAITGVNGAGKSTLLLALARLLPSSGSYYLIGKPAPAVIPEQISYVFQNPELQFITDTIIDEVLHSLLLRNEQADTNENEQPKKRNSLLKLFTPRSKRGTSAKAKQLRLALTEQAVAALDQLKLHIPYERHPYELSIGQKRRLSVLTALVEGRSILLLDEPTFGQDARSTFVMLEWLLQLQAAGNTIVMVTHDEQIAARFATQIWQVQDGQLKVKLPQDAASDKEADDEQRAELVYT